MSCLALPGCPCPVCGATLLVVWAGERGECLACGGQMYSMRAPRRAWLEQPKSPKTRIRPPRPRVFDPEHLPPAA